jgi:hypothetical protein
MEVEAVEGSLFITTDEDIKLVRSACPELVDKLQHEKTVEHFKKHGRVVTLGSPTYRSGFRPGDVDAVSENTIDTENGKDVWQP